MQPLVFVERVTPYLSETGARTVLDAQFLVAGFEYSIRVTITYVEVLLVVRSQGGGCEWLSD